MILFLYSTQLPLEHPSNMSHMFITKTKTDITHTTNKPTSVILYCLFNSSAHSANRQPSFVSHQIHRPKNMQLSFFPQAFHKSTYFVKSAFFSFPLVPLDCSIVRLRITRNNMAKKHVHSFTWIKKNLWLWQMAKLLPKVVFFILLSISLFLSQELLLWHCIVFRLDLLKIKTKWWLASMLCNNNSAPFRLFMTSREMINTLVIYSKSFSDGICFV